MNLEELKWDAIDNFCFAIQILDLILDITILWSL